MADNVPSWMDLLTAFFKYPEKSALALVVLVGAWRWIRDLMREKRDDETHETLVKMLMRENRQLRIELERRLTDKHDDQ